ncbi:hypothetical protein Tco_0516108 [Tanacetum coccineum]
MRAEHTLEKKSELEDKYAEQTALLSEKDAEIAHLKSLLYLKESETAKAISLRSQLSVVEATDAAKSTELKDLMEKNFALEGERNILSEKVAKLTADLSGLQLSHDELNSKVASLESERDCLASEFEKMQDEQVGVLSERVTAIDYDLIEMPWAQTCLAKCLSLPEYLSAMGEAIGRSIDKGVSFSLLAQFEAHKDSSMADSIDLLRLEGPAAETSEASQLQPSLDQLMIPIHCLEDQVIIGETSLDFSLEVAHNRVQRVRGDAATYRLSLTDSILPLMEPFSARNLTSKASSSVDFTTAVTTVLSTTFAQTNPAPTMLSTKVPPSPKIVF